MAHRLPPHQHKLQQNKRRQQRSARRGVRPSAAGQSRAEPAQAHHDVAGEGRQHQPGHPAAGAVGEAEAGHRRYDHVEGVGGIAAVRPRVGEERDQGEHLDEGAGPAVGDEQRHRRRPPPALMNHVDADAVHLGPEVRHRVHRPLRRGAAHVDLDCG